MPARDVLPLPHRAALRARDYEVDLVAEGDDRDARAMNVMNQTAGAAASTAWLEERGLDAAHTPHWYIEITIDSDTVETCFELNIYPEEWGFVFRRGARVSSIRVTDIAFVHGRDDHQLLADTPSLANIGELLAWIERRYDVVLHRTRATVKSNLVRATAVVRPWLVSAR